MSGPPLAPLGRDPFYARGVVMVAAGAVCLSSSGVLIRLIERAGGWQILFWRSLALALFVTLFLALRHRGRVVAPVRAVGVTGVLVGLLLALAFTGFVFAMLTTTVANVMFTFGAIPFMAALLAWWVLGETIRRATAVALVVSLAGIGLMVADGLATGRLRGNLIALATSLAFALQLVLLRRARHIDMIPATGLAGLFTATLAATFADGLAVGAHDLVICVLLGTVNVGAGIMLVTAGARFVPAGEVALLALLESVLAPVWAALFVGEIPSLLTLAGGVVVLGAVTGQALLALRRQRARVG